MSAKKENLLLLFDRPQEPVFVPKGDKKQSFEVPQHFLVTIFSNLNTPLLNWNVFQAERFKETGAQLQNRFGAESDDTIPVKDISIPDLGEILNLGRHENFSLFLPTHRRMAGRLIDIFLGTKQLEGLN